MNQDGLERSALGISATVPDWSREHKTFWAWAPSRSLLASIRAWQRHAGRHNPLSYAVRKLAVVRHRFWSVVTGADIPITCRLGGGLLLPHPNGVVVHADAIVGPNCLLFQQVTLAGSEAGPPHLEGHNEIGTGAKIIGGVTIAAHARVGANAVVTRDVAAGDTVAGIPAVSTRRQ